VSRADAGRARERVVEHEAQWETFSGDRKAVWRVGRDDEQVSSPGAPPPRIDSLHALAGQIENQLSVVVTVGRHLGVAVPVQLELAQDETQSVDFDFLN
jgi:hypothetical protein